MISNCFSSLFVSNRNKESYFYSNFWQTNSNIAKSKIQRKLQSSMHLDLECVWLLLNIYINCTIFTNFSRACKIWMVALLWRCSRINLLFTTAWPLLCCHRLVDWDVVRRVRRGHLSHYSTNCTTWHSKYSFRYSMICLCICACESEREAMIEETKRGINQSTHRNWYRY